MELRLSARGFLYYLKAIQSDLHVNLEHLTQEFITETIGVSLDRVQTLVDNLHAEGHLTYTRGMVGTKKAKTVRYRIQLHTELPLLIPPHYCYSYPAIYGLDGLGVLGYLAEKMDEQKLPTYDIPIRAFAEQAQVTVGKLRAVIKTLVTEGFLTNLTQTEKSRATYMLRTDILLKASNILRLCPLGRDLYIKVVSGTGLSSLVDAVGQVVYPPSYRNYYASTKTPRHPFLFERADKISDLPEIWDWAIEMGLNKTVHIQEYQLIGTEVMLKRILEIEEGNTFDVQQGLILVYLKLKLHGKPNLPVFVVPQAEVFEVEGAYVLTYETVLDELVKFKKHYNWKVKLPK